MFKEWWVRVDSNHRPHPYQEIGHNLSSKEIDLPNLMYRMHTTGKVPTDRQLNAVKRIYQRALNDGFYFKK